MEIQVFECQTIMFGANRVNHVDFAYEHFIGNLETMMSYTHQSRSL